mgnify:FL=1
MQAITTKYINATNNFRARVSAKCLGGRITLTWDDALDVEANHDTAALALATKFGWNRPKIYGRMVRGALPSREGNVYVFTGRGDHEVLP